MVLYEYLHISLTLHPWWLLKTTGSKRLIPIVGAAYEAVKIMHRQRKTPFLFNSYKDVNSCNGNSCSAALNKWLKHRLPEGCVIHSFRHSLRDRLRAVECPTDIIDAIGGWTTAGIGNQYGLGHKLETKLKWMKALEPSCKVQQPKLVNSET